MTRRDTGTNEVRACYRTRTVHDTVHDKPAPFPLPCPILPFPRLLSEARTVRHTSPPLSSALSPSLCARTVESNVHTLPCPARPSPSLLRFSGMLSSLVCPTSLALPVPSSLVPTSPRCMTLRKHAAHCTFGGGLPCGSTLRHPAVSRAPARCGWPARLRGTCLLLPLVRSF